MGDCCCKSRAPDVFVYAAPGSARSSTSSEHRQRAARVDPNLVNQLVLEMLNIAASRVDNPFYVNSDEDSPVSLVKLHLIADKEEGWLQMISSMANVIPVENPFGPTAISILLDACPLPSRESVVKVSEMFNLSNERARAERATNRVDRNICVVLGCLAEKLVGPNSIAMLTTRTLDFLYTLIAEPRDPLLCLFAMVAMEKFAHTMENKLKIKQKFTHRDNPLVGLENHSNDEDFVWRQVGFVAAWLLDNLFMVEGRQLSFERQDMSGINAILNCRDVSEYLQIAPNGLEARCDSYSFESVRCTYQADEGCWYYEATMITPGVMQIGWATKNSHFLSDGFGIGDDLYSISYDGCRKLVWYNAKPTAVDEVQTWQPGDVLGCLIDLNTKEVIFSLNGHRLPPCNDIFEATRYGFFAAASFMAYQQCRFNFGKDPFRYPPVDRLFATFNDFGILTEEQKMVKPKRLYLQQMRTSSVKEDSCTLCYDATACCILDPCGHRGFCSVCTSLLRECPMCRGSILNVRRELI
ncbi:RING finger and SPRY domain-containing protein 1-like isoform X2 [Colias croceus]|uniref:RING finger and SPRY domain-containing protein 1-like isoform X2 n=1 Tax=Colias crocea TaxID=72248 RepID=UPI001E27BAC3|nr:RING finger and SPRY domain-containing protein 1-like isoform X2 [Colias croceus]